MREVGRLSRSASAEAGDQGQQRYDAIERNEGAGRAEEIRSMSYEVIVDDALESKLARFPVDVYDRIMAKLALLAENPRPPGCKRLKDETAVGWRIRVGKNRILYQIDRDKQRVFVYEIDLRSNAYRN